MSAQIQADSAQLHLQLFDYTPAAPKLRTEMDAQGNIWFVAADVCKILNLANVTKALLVLDDDEQALNTIQGLSRGNEQASLQMPRLGKGVANTNTLYSEHAPTTMKGLSSQSTLTTMEGASDLTTTQIKAYTWRIAAIVAVGFSSLKHLGERLRHLEYSRWFFCALFSPVGGLGAGGFKPAGFSLMTSLLTRIQLAFFSFSSELGESYQEAPL